MQKGKDSKDTLVAQFFRSLTPTTLSVSEFAARAFRVQPPGSLYWERFDINKTPYLKRPMDLCSYYSGVRQIDFVKSVKIGATVGMILPVLLYNVLVGRKNQYYVSADQKLLDEYIQVKVRPHFAASGAMEQIGLKDSQNEKKEKQEDWRNRAALAVCPRQLLEVLRGQQCEQFSPARNRLCRAR